MVWRMGKRKIARILVVDQPEAPGHDRKSDLHAGLHAYVHQHELIPLVRLAVVEIQVLHPALGHLPDDRSLDPVNQPR